MLGLAPPLSNTLLFCHPAVSPPQAMDASAEECQTATQHKGTVMPISKAAPTLEKMAITAEMKVSSGTDHSFG